MIKKRVERKIQKKIKINNVEGYKKSCESDIEGNSM
jgi:hypothetical protein